MLRSGAIILLLFSLGWMTSCENDEPDPVTPGPVTPDPDDPDDPAVPDTVGPDIVIVSPENNAVIWDTVAITLEVSDTSGIDTVQVFIDAALDTTFTAPPYVVEWNTNPLAEGSHSIKVTASDTVGNTAEKEIAVTVKNILVSFTVPVNHLRNEGEWTSQGFVFLSDADGKLIASVEIANGQNVEIKAPGFKGETFYLTQSEVETFSGNNFVRLQTFSDVERGSWTLLSEVPEEVSTAGTATLNFSNPLTNATYTVASNGDDFAWPSEGNLTSEILLRESPSKLYITRFADSGTPAPSFHLFPDIVLGANAIDLEEVSEPLTKLTPALPADVTHVEVDLFGFPSADNFAESYNLGFFYEVNETDQFVTAYKPGEAFPSYYAYLYTETPEYILRRGTKNIDAMDFTPLQFEGDVRFTDSVINASITGSIDFVTAGYETADEASQWTFFLPTGSDVNIGIPEVPDALKDFEITVINGAPHYFTVYDLESMTNYAEMKTYLRNSTYGLDELYQPGKEYADLFMFKDGSPARIEKAPGKARPVQISQRFEK